MADGNQRGLDTVKGLLRATEVARAAEVVRAANGILFSSLGETGIAATDLRRTIEAVPARLAEKLDDKVYFFVPLALPEGRGHRGATEETLVAPVYTAELADEAVCHRNVALGEGREGVFLSARLLRDHFAVAFEFFINVAHAFGERAGLQGEMNELLLAQAAAGVRGETSRDAFEARELVTKDRTDLKAQGEFLQYGFSDALAVYQLSLALDFDYSELREREYPLLTPAALAERLRLMAKLYPPNEGYEFSIRYRRRA